MSPLAADLEAAGQHFPRVSGDEPVGRHALQVSVQFSPRERG